MENQKQVVLQNPEKDPTLNFIKEVWKNFVNFNTQYLSRTMVIAVKNSTLTNNLRVKWQTDDLKFSPLNSLNELLANRSNELREEIYHCMNNNLGEAMQSNLKTVEGIHQSLRISNTSFYRAFKTKGKLPNYKLAENDSEENLYPKYLNQMFAESLICLSKFEHLLAKFYPSYKPELPMI